MYYCIIHTSIHFMFNNYNNNYNFYYRFHKTSACRLIKRFIFQENISVILEFARTDTLERHQSRKFYPF